MIVEITTKLVVDLEIIPPDALNSDSQEEYKEDLLCTISNQALDFLDYHLPNTEEIEIQKIIPEDEEFEKQVNTWKSEYKKEISKFNIF